MRARYIYIIVQIVIEFKLHHCTSDSLTTYITQYGVATNDHRHGISNYTDMWYLIAFCAEVTSRCITCIMCSRDIIYIFNYSSNRITHYWHISFNLVTWGRILWVTVPQLNFNQIKPIFLILIERNICLFSLFN